MSQIKKIDNEYYLIISSRVYGDVYYRIDKEDCDRISKYNWSVAKRHHGIYAYCNEKYAIIEERLLHRFIINCPRNMVVDHINRDTLDNRKENLRICTYSENNKNMSKPINSSNKYRFITEIKEKKRKQKYELNIRKEFRARYYTLEEAKLARDNYLKQHDIFTYNQVMEEEQ